MTESVKWAVGTADNLRWEDAMLAAVAEQLWPQADTVAQKMVRTYTAEIPAYRTIDDAALLADVQHVSASIVRLWLAAMGTGRSPDKDTLTPLLEGARRRAVQGIDAESVLRAYRIGVRVMWREIVASPACRSESLQSDLTRASTWLLEFSDEIITEVAAAYTGEAARAVNGWERRRSALFNAILSGYAPEQRHGPEELQGQHCVIVAKLPSDLPLAELKDKGRLLERRAGVMVWTVRHCSVVAAFALPYCDRRERLRQRQRLADLTNEGHIVAFGLGGNAEGAVETRHSYAEASDALELGPRLSRTEHGVHDYRDPAPMIALLAEPDRARRFAATALEPFASLMERKWMLPTVEAYLSRQGRLKQIAAMLGIHLNTVKYRVNELRPILDDVAGEGDRAAALPVAIRIHRHFLRGPDRGIAPSV